MGITTGIFRFAAERNSNRGEVFSSAMVLLGSGLGAVTLIGLPLCLFGGFRTQAILILVYVLLADVQAVCAQYVRAIDRTRLYAVQGILNTLLTVACNVIFLAVFQMGVTGYVLAVVVGNLLTTVFLVISARLWRVFRLSLVRRETVKELLLFSLPMVPTTVCWLITDLSDRYFVSAICGGVTNGIYSAAYKIPTIVNLLSSIFMMAWQFSAVTQAADEEECKRFYSKVFRGFLSLIFAGTAFLLVCSRFLTTLLLNSAYREAYRFMPTLLCAAAVESVVSFLATVYLVRKKTVHSFLTAIAGTLANLLLNAILIPIPHVGALGAALATLASYLLVWGLRTWDVPRLLRFRQYLPRQILNFLLLFSLAAVMTFMECGRLLLSLILALIILAVNVADLLHSFAGILKRRRVL